MQQIDGDALLNQLGIDELKRASIFGALSDAAIGTLINQGCVYTLNKGEKLFEAGTRGDSFFVVLKGTIGYHQAFDGHSEYIRDFRFGEEIGFVSMVALIPRPGTAVAVSEACVLEISNDQFYTLHCDLPTDFGLLMMNLSRGMARRIVILLEMLAEEKKSDGQHRLPQ